MHEVNGRRLPNKTKALGATSPTRALCNERAAEGVTNAPVLSNGMNTVTLPVNRMARLAHGANGARSSQPGTTPRGNRPNGMRAESPPPLLAPDPQKTSDEIIVSTMTRAFSPSHSTLCRDMGRCPMLGWMAAVGLPNASATPIHLPMSKEGFFRLRQ